MNIIQIFARDTDGVIRRIQTSSDNFGAPEAGTTRVARFDVTAYPQHYNVFKSMVEFVRFIDGALVLEHPILGTSTIATAQWIANREAEITDSEQLAAAAAIALAQGKVYLRNQLFSENPDATAIFNTMQAQVVSNPYLLQMVTNQRNLMQATFGWGALDTGTVQGRVRYIMVVQQVIALLT